MLDSGTYKYMDIVSWASEQIDQGQIRPASRFPSEAELGHSFACSRQTVRRALEVLEEQGKIVRIQGSGTFVAERGQNGSLSTLGRPSLTMTVGMIVTFMDNYIFPSIVKGVEGVFSERGFALQLISTNNLVTGEAKALEIMHKRQLDGLIVEPTRSALPCANIDLFRAIEKQGTPMVFVDSYYPELSAPYVALDDVRAGYEATIHLIDRGHREIAGIFPHSNRQGHLRYLGYLKALSERQIPIQEHHIVWFSRENMMATLQSPQLLNVLSTCTALLSYNDWEALKIINHLRENGKMVPDDISVVGIDDSDIARAAGLTSIAHPAKKLGEAAAEMLLSMIDGEPGATQLFPPRLVERSSVRTLDA